MKKLILTFSLLIASVVTYGQFCFYNQSFETPVTGVTSIGTPGFVPDTQLYHDGVQSYVGSFNTGDSAILTTDDADLSGNTFVILKFWHICKLEFFDQGLVEVSSDGGQNWTILDCNNSQYLGASQFCSGQLKFMEASYPVWQPGSSTFPDSSWWREEQFDVSALLGTGSVTNAKVRFVAHDLNTPPNGMNGRAGWFIDEVCLLAAPCELTDPLFAQNSPVLQGTVYSLGPYNLNTWATDASGIAGVYVFYSINGVSQPTIPMFNPGGDSLYTATLPGVNNGDTVCYSFYVFDASACGNDIYYPDPLGIGQICFVASSGITLDFCDNLDVNNLWVDSTLTGSHWELGTPNFGLTNSPHSPPNAWDISLNSGYVSGTEAYLYSPVIDIAGKVNAQMSFWYNCSTDNFSQDGARLEASADNGTWTTLSTVQDPSAVNWYNISNLSSSGQPGWGGNSGGWKEAKFNLNSFTGASQFALRLVFTSEAFSTGDGFSFDDFCIIQPEPEDMGVDKVIEPFPSAGANTTSNAIVRVRNFGTATQTMFDVWYDAGAGPVGPTPYLGSLAPNDTAIITMPTFIVPNLGYTFCAWTSLPNDANTANDTLCVARQGIPVVPLTYCNDFDVSGADWTSIPSPVGNTLWELGTPAFGATNSAFSAPNAWDINLTTAYENSADAILVSPFFDFLPAANVDISFWQNRNCETGWDGTHIEYSDNGNPWQILGGVGQGVNWYTNPSINSCTCPAWDGNSNGWIKSSLNVSQFNNIGLVQLQFVFTSDASVTQDGFSIDNFCLHVPQPIDVGADSILSPTANAGAGQSVDVIVRVRNFGSTAISAFDVNYDDGSGQTGTVAYAGPTLLPNDVALVTIPPQMIVPAGPFCMKAYTSLATDMDNTNDTVNQCMFGVPVVTLNYCNDFDSGIIDWSSIPSPIGNTTWQLGTPAFGNTTGAHSAPNAWDVNLTTAYGNQNNTYAYLLSPFFDFTPATNVQLAFWNNWNTEQAWDGTRLDYSQASTGGAWTMLGAIGSGVNWYTNTIISSGNQPAWAGNSNGWKKSEFNMSQFNLGGLVQLRFGFSSDGSVTVDGASIDDFCLKIPPPFDGGVESIDIPTQQGLAINQTYPITVTVRNYGQNPISNFPVVYTVNGINPQSTIFGGTLLPNQTAQLPLTPNLTATPLNMDVCAWTEVPNDGDATNDTTCRTYVGVPTFIPTYTDDFDGLNNGWTTTTASPASQWELGTPAFGATNSPHSPPNCWDINLNSAYTNNATCELISPYFDFSNVINAEVSFWINYNTGTNDDGVRLDYSADGGNNYQTLETAACATCLNWYPSNITGGFPAWNGNSGGWIFAKDSDLSFLNGNALDVRFKFVFTSSGFGTSDGVSIDDFLLYKPITITAATDSVYPANNILTPGPQYIVGRYLNKGTTPVTKVLLSLVIDSVLWVTDTINPIPVPGGVLNLGIQATHVFSLPWNASPGQHTFCIYTSLPNDSVDLFTADDTTCTVLTVFDSTSVYPYCNDFESPPQWVTLNSANYGPISSWQIGTPIKTNIIGAHSGANCWVTNLVSEYPNLDNSSLFSPVFNVQAGKFYELSFWHNDDMDLFNDGGSVDFTIDSAKTWKQLGDGGDQINWYNSNYIAAFGGPPLVAGWTGTTGGWLESKHCWESPFNGQVIFRWKFASDLTHTADGWAIDDVCFKEIGTCVTAIGEVSANQLYLYQNAPNPVNGKTSIAFSLPKSGKAVMTVTNLVGQVVAMPVNEKLAEGRHSVDLNSKDFAPGIYYYTLKFDGRKIVRKMVVVE